MICSFLGPSSCKIFKVQRFPGFLDWSTDKWEKRIIIKKKKEYTLLFLWCGPLQLTGEGQLHQGPNLQSPQGNMGQENHQRELLQQSRVGTVVLAPEPG